MKLLYRYIFLIILIGGVSFAQVIPNNYDLTSKKSLAKTNDENPTGNGVTDIVVIGDTIWVGTGNGLSVSFDNGNNWKSFTGTSAFGTEDISAISYDNGVIWVATAHKETINNESVDVGTGLKYTIDNGNIWTSIPQPIDNDNDVTIVYGSNTLNTLPVTVPQQNVTFDIAFTPGTVWITSWAGGLRKSSNYGVTWERVVLPPDNLNEIKPADTLNFCLAVESGNFCSQGNLNHVAFSVIVPNDSTLFVGTANGINRSTDGGVSWKKVNHQNQNNPISGNFVPALGFNNVNNTIWAATWVADQSGEFYGVSLSNDLGENWTVFLNGERTHNFGFKGTDVIAVSDNGAFRSNNLGSTWITPSFIQDTNSKLTLTTNVFYSAGSNNNDIWLGSSEGLAKFTEKGGMWSGNWKLFIASQPLLNSDESYAFPNPFIPSIERLKIKYSTGGKSVPVTIRIFDFGMNYIATVIQNVTRGNPIHNVDSSGIIDYWDGKDANGNIVPNGVYFYRIDAGGSIQYGKFIVLK